MLNAYKKYQVPMLLKSNFARSIKFPLVYSPLQKIAPHLSRISTDLPPGNTPVLNYPVPLI